MAGSAHAQDIGIGIQVSPTAIVIIAADADGNIEHTRMVEGDFSNSNPEEVLAKAGELARAAIAECHTNHHVVGVGLALPGLINSRVGYLETASNLGWGEFYPWSLLGFGDIPVQVANDAKLGAIAEWQVSGEPSFIYLTVGTGIGGAILFDGKLYRGERGWDSEIGHLTVDPNGPKCVCGSNGCLEQYASKGALFRAAGLSADATVADFVDQYKAGDAKTIAAFDAGVAAVAQVLANVITLTDIRHLIIEGELLPLMPLLKGRLAKLIESRVFAGDKAPLAYHAAMAGDIGPALGGALLAQTGF